MGNLWFPTTACLLAAAKRLDFAEIEYRVKRDFASFKDAENAPCNLVSREARVKSSRRLDFRTFCVAKGEVRNLWFRSIHHCIEQFAPKAQIPRPVAELNPALTKQSTARRQGALTPTVKLVSREARVKFGRRPNFRTFCVAKCESEICDFAHLQSQTSHFAPAGGKISGPVAELYPALTKQSTAPRLGRDTSRNQTIDRPQGGLSRPVAELDPALTKQSTAQRRGALSPDAVKWVILGSFLKIEHLLVIFGVIFNLKPSFLGSFLTPPKKQHYWGRWISTCLSSAVFRPSKNSQK